MSLDGVNLIGIQYLFSRRSNLKGVHVPVFYPGMQKLRIEIIRIQLIIVKDKSFIIAGDDPLEAVHQVLDVYKRQSL